MKFRFTCDSLIPADDEAVSWFASLESGDEVELTAQVKRRTSSQQAAIEVYCRELASALNDAGYDRIQFPWKEGVEIPWTQATVKEELWRPIQQAVLEKASTTRLGTQEVNTVYEILGKKIAELTGVTLGFPSRSAA